jgi:integrase
MLEEGICDHRHERMTVKALPGSSLEVIETEFFFQLLVSLLANPSRLDGGRQGAQVRLRRQVGEIEFLLSRHPVFADEPGLLSGQPTLLHGHALEAPALISLHTGMRRGELLALKWRNIDLEDEVIRVRESLEQTRAGLRFKEPKSKAGNRDITLPALAVDILQAHRKRELERRLMTGQGRLGDNDLVFPAWDGTPWAPNSFGSTWSKLSRELGLGVSFHALRHTHASFLLDLGNVDVVTISKRLGHSSPAVTLSIYAHLIRQDDRKAANAINAALGR